MLEIGSVTETDVANVFLLGVAVGILAAVALWVVLDLLADFFGGRR